VNKSHSAYCYGQLILLLDFLLDRVMVSCVDKMHRPDIDWMFTETRGF